MNIVRTPDDDVSSVESSNLDAVEQEASSNMDLYLKAVAIVDDFTALRKMPTKEEMNIITDAIWTALDSVGLTRRQLVKYGTFSSAMIAVSLALNFYLPTITEHSIGFKHGQNDTAFPFFESEPFQLGANLQLNRVGVLHEFETYKKNEARIIQLIDAASGGVILEYFGDRIAEMTESSWGKLEAESKELTSKLPTSAAFWFYAAIGKSCAELGREIIVVNPQRDLLSIGEMAIMFGLPAAAVLKAQIVKMDQKLIHDEDIDEQQPDKIDKLFAKEATRRKFLNWTREGVVFGIPAYLIAGMAAAMTSITRFFEKLPHGDEVEDKLNMMALGTIDWRNIITAERLSQLAAIDSGVIAQFEGQSHDSGVMYYLHHPDIRRQKLRTYATLNSVASPAKRYLYRQEQGWIERDLNIK